MKINFDLDHDAKTKQNKTQQIYKTKRTEYSCAPVPNDSVSAAYHRLKKI
jgi:hypothetical protein